MTDDDKDLPRDARSLVDETRAFWRDLARETVKTSTTSIEETAKQLIGITAILEGLYFHAITFADLRGAVAGLLPMLAYLAPLVFWTFSLIAAGLVFFPRMYEMNLNSSEASKALHENAVRRKYWCLVIALGWLAAGAMFLIAAVGIYLNG
jgi:hypothetical protein